MSDFVGLVYVARNRINGKVYVGQTTKTLEYRKRSHERSAKAGSRLVFHKAIRKYGLNSFSWVVVCCVYAEDGYGVGWHEQSIIEYMKYTNNILYNVSVGGDSSALGMNHTEENKALMGQASRQRWEGRRATDLYPPECLSLGFTQANREFGIPKTTYYRMKRR